MTGALATTEPDAGGEAGFTLVELLVALALFSLLVTLLFDNVRFGLHAWRQGSAHAENIDHGMIVQDLLRRMIENAYPMLAVDSGTPLRICLLYTSDAADE